MTVTDDDVRKAKRERQFHSARDFETSASQIGEVEPFAEGVQRKAQLIVAANARGRSQRAKVADAEEMMRMLGIHPSQPPLVDPLSLPLPNPRSAR